MKRRRLPSSWLPRRRRRRRLSSRRLFSNSATTTTTTADDYPVVDVSPLLSDAHPGRAESVAAIGRDFQGRRKPQYARAHIVFTGHLPDELLQQISQNRNLCGRIAALKELNMEFLACEDAVFSVEMKNAFYDLYAVPAPAAKATTQAKMAQRLASLCVTLGSQNGDLPLIRFDSASAVASEVASALGESVKAAQLSALHCCPLVSG